jgi:hypothetical protein
MKVLYGHGLKYVNSYDFVMTNTVLTCYMLNNSFEFSLFIVIIFEIYILIGNPIMAVLT